jgi:uncharacterized protein YcgI (DUF1989 family)
MSGYQHDVPAGAGWSLTVRPGQRVTMTCRGDGANVTMLLYNAQHPVERLNLPDTLKAQMSMRVRSPMVLMSDLGRAMFAVTESTVDWHDAVCAHGPGTRRLLLDELAVYGLGPRDLHANVNWFSKVAPAGDDRATLHYVPGNAAAGDSVTLRAEQDVLVVLATTPHPLSSTSAGVGVEVSTVDGPVPVDDPSRTFRPESARALELAERGGR